MKNVYEKAVAGAEQAIRLRLDENDTILKAAQQDGGRDLSDDERETISENVRLVRGPLQEQLKTAQADLKAVEESRELGRSIGPSVPSVDASVKSEPQDRYFQNMQAGNKSLGDAFIESAGYKQAIDQYRSSGRLESGFSTEGHPPRGFVVSGLWFGWRHAHGPAGRAGCR
jgi:hypothetical protein